MIIRKKIETKKIKNYQNGVETREIDQDLNGAQGHNSQNNTKLLIHLQSQQYKEHNGRF